MTGGMIWPLTGRATSNRPSLLAEKPLHASSSATVKVPVVTQR